MAADPKAPAAELPEPKARAETQQFNFAHKVFGVAGSYFAVAADTGEATFYVPLGDVQGVLTLPQLVSGFNLAGTPDDELLTLIKKSLGFVKLKSATNLYGSVINVYGSTGIDQANSTYFGQTADANTIIASGRADLVALARGYMFDPYFPHHTAHQQGWQDMRWPNQYRGANVQKMRDF